MKEIYWEYVYPEFNICYRTFHTWLGTPAKRELKKIREQEELQKQIQPKLELW
ncbi:hypothetical protein ABMY20_12810 [Tenacibaculum sp. SSH1-16]|uniref:hypothetical protein n=1 Tax=Tenacibaculum sp. SSH1-16 TaxID=3136667 RepID=UPI0032C4A497